MDEDLESLLRLLDERFWKIYLGAVVKFLDEEPDASIYLDGVRVYASISVGPGPSFMVIHPHFSYYPAPSDRELSSLDKEFFPRINIKYIAVMSISLDAKILLHVYRNKTFEEVTKRTYPIPEEIILPNKLRFDIFLEPPLGLSLEEELASQGISFKRMKREELLALNKIAIIMNVMLFLS